MWDCEKQICGWVDDGVTFTQFTRDFIRERAKLEQSQRDNATESQRAERAETLAKEQQQEIERLRSGGAEAVVHAEQALSAAND